MGSGRNDEEGDGQNGQSHQQRLPVVAPCRPRADSQQGRQQEAVAEESRVQQAGNGPDHDARDDDCGNQKCAPQAGGLGQERPQGIGDDAPAGADPSAQARVRLRVRLLTLTRLARRALEDATQHPARYRGHHEQHGQGQRHDDDRGWERPDDVARAARSGGCVAPGSVVEPPQRPVHCVGPVGHQRPRVVCVERQVQVLAEGVDQMGRDGVEDHAREHDGGTQAEHRRGQRPPRRVDGGKVPPSQAEDAEAGEQPDGDRRQPGSGHHPVSGTEQVQPGERQTDHGSGGEAGSDRAEDALRIALAGLGPQRSTQDDETDDEAQNAELHLGEHGQHGQRRGRLAVVLL